MTLRVRPDPARPWCGVGLGLGLAWIAMTACLFSPAGTRADATVYVHVVREGETLASIAQRYYGDPRRESVIVAENGLTTQGGVPIVVGMRLVVPWVSYHRVQGGESWSRLATRFYGDARRAFMIIESNGGSAGTQPDEGAELLIPYPLRYVGTQNDSLRRVAQEHYDAEDPNLAARRLRRFNGLRGTRVARGQVILVPLLDLILSEEGRRIIEEERGQQISAGAVRSLQGRIEELLPDLRELTRQGRYTEAVALGNRLLGTGDLTASQVVTIQRELAAAYVALAREDLAVGAFRVALERQPLLELDVARTSPRVLAAFERAKQQLATRPAR